MNAPARGKNNLRGVCPLPAGRPTLSYQHKRCSIKEKVQKTSPAGGCTSRRSRSPDGTCFDVLFEREITSRTRQHESHPSGSAGWWGSVKRKLRASTSPFEGVCCAECPRHPRRLTNRLCLSMKVIRKGAIQCHRVTRRRAAGVSRLMSHEARPISGLTPTARLQSIGEVDPSGRRLAAWPTAELLSIQRRISRLAVCLC